MSDTTHDLAGARAKFEQIKTDLGANFVERDRLIPVLMALVLGKMNALLMGPPGTAKSALVNAVCHSMGNGSVFSYLLTRYTTPDEIFGPLSISGLKNDRYARVTKGFIPEASVAFLDEIWKANSSILNSLLTILNERKFFNDGKWIELPLRATIGASNELPEGPELEALYDRFIARFWIKNLTSKDSRLKVMNGQANAQPSPVVLSPDEIDLLSAAASALPFDPGIDDKMIEIEDRLQEKGIVIGDRRRRAIWRVLPYVAFAFNHDAVNDDTIIDIVPDLAWRTPDQRTTIYKVCSEVANPLGAKAQEILDAASETIANATKARNDAKNGVAGARKSDALSQINGARMQMEDMIKKMLDLDKTKTNGRVKSALAELDKNYRSVMGMVMEQANLKSFGGNDMTESIAKYLGVKQ